ncbi:gamma carbonic anhydrase family protein [Phytohabitans rumicis]|uniref:Gamma carbonic anhydrase family protein n=1 Tax=Phytohabitans rumicis TaxID=1076125 RepID=A0A6V8LMC3_9ACTN|nr:gamma carbonic anhydrase family protein [Phytohabitans rumicis]GFJ96161.1 gamma carbonic anhydrase family protein [Phytohabitans rumicis]
MAVYALGDLVPAIDPDAYVHPDAVVIGAVTLAAGASVWPAAVLRGDYGRIAIGPRTSVQDGTVVHTTAQWPTVVGARCVVGHNAHLEGCRVGDDCLIGSGAVVLNRATVEDGAAVGAAALVVEDAVVPSGHIALGVPARPRPAPDLATWVTEAVDLYADLAQRYRAELRRIG